VKTLARVCLNGKRHSARLRRESLMFPRASHAEAARAAQETSDVRSPRPTPS
jgi:hypothetical protein